jgi:hypothetical protein
MYKDRFKKWNLDKKIKERDAVAIFRKKRQRDALGKDTAIRVRGRPIDMADLARYLRRRKGTPIADGSGSSTPSDISCRTPSPVPTLRGIEGSQIAQYGFSATQSNCGLYDGGFGTSMLLTQVDNSVDQHTLQQTSKIEICLEYSSGIPRSPSSPLSFSIQEQLFSTIKSYFRGSCERRIWVTDSHGYFIPLNPVTVKVDHDPSDLDLYFSMAVKLLKKGSIVEFRQVLSKGFGIIEDLLQAQHPRALDNLFGVFIRLIQNGKMEIVSMLRGYISQMATKILPKGSPWGEVCRILVILDAESFEGAIMESWKCIIDVWGECVGPFHASALDSHVMFIDRVHGSKDLLEQERMLRGLLAQVEQSPGISPMRVTTVLRSLGDNILYQGRDVEAEQIGLEIISRAQREEGSVFINDRMNALEIIACSQYGQHKNELAERNSRDLLRIGSKVWGEKDPWVVAFMVRLEEWLRDWGREGEAEDLRAEREELMALDEMDAELAGVTVQSHLARVYTASHFDPKGG